MRITKSILQRKIDYLNHVSGQPPEAWSRDSEGKLKANIGCYHRSGAYGGHSLQQMVNEGGGIRSVFNVGHISARELAGLIDAYILGILDTK